MIRLTALGSAVPAGVVTNDDLAARIATTDEWIRSRSGIGQRRVAADGVATSELATAAGRQALAQHRGKPPDAVVLATTTPDHVIPGTAPDVAARLGLTGAAAFDVNAACSGFIHILAVAAGLVTAGVARRVLAIGADSMSRFIDPADRGTAVLFGDGAGAVVLEAGPADGPGSVTGFDLGADGTQQAILLVPAGGSRAPASRSTVDNGEHTLRMAGREVYRHAVAGMTASARRTLAACGLAADDVHHLVGHQANLRILDAVAEHLDIPPAKRVVNIDRYGNTSAASIPLALVDLAARAVPGDRVLLTAFGAGLSWGSALLRWPALAAPVPVPELVHPIARTERTIA